ncbi:MAG: DUF1566 domain-containing protein [Myxococcaceae bacterium]|nr:DUF1566 domain-containing protein [Myxococcaceae bacterium]MBH2005862.1 DUF1566 domain-containing protein [Myxococcaceae bacterium]
MISLKPAFFAAFLVLFIHSLHAEQESLLDSDTIEDQYDFYRPWSSKAYQDGTHQRRRYKILQAFKSEIILDSFTGLYWERQASTSGMSWDKSKASGSAQSYCASLKKGGFLDWRVPSPMELQSLVDYTLDSAPSINQQAFPEALPDFFWTSMSYMASPQYAWGFFFQNADLGMDLSESGAASTSSVRCVRGSKIPLKNRFTDQDGKPIQPTSTRVLDRATGFVWQRIISQESFDLEGAISYCRQFGLEGASWRLPSIKELLTIVDYSSYKPSIHRIVFPETLSSKFWSSTPFVGQSGTMWGLNFAHGRTSILGSAQKFMLRCIRDL